MARLAGHQAGSFLFGAAAAGVKQLGGHIGELIPCLVLQGENKTKAVRVDSETRSSIVYNTFYQWVPLYLIFMAFLFYLPRMFWLSMEGGIMKFLCKGTTTRNVEDADEKRIKLIRFFCKNIYNKYNIYFAGFVFCEFLNFSMVALLIYLTHRFLHYRFLTYGFEVSFI